MNEGHRQRFKSYNGLTGEIPTCRHLRSETGELGPIEMLVISMEKSSEKHVSLVEGGPALMQNVRVLKS